MLTEAGIRRTFLTAIALFAAVSTSYWWHGMALVGLSWLTFAAARPYVQLGARHGYPEALTLTAACLAQVALVTVSIAMLMAFGGSPPR